jgi:ribonuclease/clavin/mitogillin
MMTIRPIEITPSISAFATRTPTLLPATHTNSYAMGSRDVILIEPATPYEDEQRAWIEWARGLESQGRRAIAIALTHHHEDHVGGVDVLSRELNLPVWAHDETAKRIDAKTPIARRLIDGETITLDGPEPMKIRVLHTPGHAPGHVCFFDEASGVIIVGDMVASVGTILIMPSNGGTGDGDMRAYITQLERLIKLNAKTALPAHGERIDDPNVLLRRYIAHRLLREKKIAGVIAEAKDGLDLGEIVPRAYDDVSPALYPIAMMSVMAHLEKLIAEGNVVREGDRFRVAS